MQDGACRPLEDDCPIILTGIPMPPTVLCRQSPPCVVEMIKLHGRLEFGRGEPLLEEEIQSSRVPAERLSVSVPSVAGPGLSGSTRARITHCVVGTRLQETCPWTRLFACLAKPKA